MQPEVIDLSFDDEEVPSLHKETSSMMHHPVWTNPDLAQVPYMVDPVSPNYEAHQVNKKSLLMNNNLKKKLIILYSP